MNVLAYITDLFFQAKVGETGRAVDVKVQITSTLHRFMLELEKSPAAVLIDLDAKGINASVLIAQIKVKDPQLPVIAYGTHVRRDKMESARKSGADHVLPRSEFSKNLGKILEQYRIKENLGKD